MAHAPVLLHLSGGGASRVGCKLRGLYLGVELLLDLHFLVLRDVLLSGGNKALAEPVRGHDATVGFTTLAWAYEARGR